MKICLINPPMDGRKRPKYYQYEESIYTMQHIGLGYISSNLIKNGYEVDIIECPMDNLNVQQLLQIILDGKYKIVGFSIYYYNIGSTAMVIQRLRSKMKDDIFIFAGGYLPSLRTNAVFDIIPSLNCVVIGEGEQISLELMNSIKKNNNWKKVKGIAYKDNGKVIINEQPQPIKDLDILNFPTRKISESSKIISIDSARGCYNSCSFCGIREFYNKAFLPMLRFRSVKSVLNEIYELIAKYKPDMLSFIDDTFLIGSKMRQDWIEEFCLSIESNGINFDFNFQSKAIDIINSSHLLKKLKKCGLAYIFVGIESFVQRQLDYYNKATTVEENIEAMKILFDNGIQTKMGFILLDPYSTLNEIIENLSIINSLGIISNMHSRQYLFSSTVLFATPGTKIYYDLQKENMLNSSKLGYDFVDPLVNAIYPTIKEWNSILEKLDAKFRLIVKYKNEGNPIAQKLLDYKHKLLQLDIDFLIDLSKAGLNNISSVSVLLEGYLSQFDEIENNVIKLLDA